jgi:cysteinyl-tRNA synthetase
MSLKIYDTRLREKTEFKPIRKGEVRMYNCGPTVYDFAHIGNLRSFLFADMLRRWLEVSGYKVTQVMNLTDVDDKTIRRSREEAVPLSSVTSPFIDAFFEDTGRLGILPAHIYPKATEHIDAMTELISELLERGHAYRSDEGSIYFKVESFPEYGKLSGKRLEDLRLGERVTSDEYESKDDVRDFALWKAWDESDGDVFWETELGKGRPGWHIECSAMSRKHLGSRFDIHTGGVDNIFPHHENEIAQSHCAGDEFANHWMHCNYLIVEGKKMSKSLGNFYTLRDLLEKGWNAREIRYVLIGTHYRSQLNFTLDGLAAAKTSLQRLDDFRISWYSAKDGKASELVRVATELAARSFSEAMNDDLNVSSALASIFQLVREVNAQTAQNGLTSGDVDLLKTLWKQWDHALGLLTSAEDDMAGGFDKAWIESMIEQRQQARLDRDFARADEIRDELAEEGIELRDGPEGTTWRVM